MKPLRFNDLPILTLEADDGAVEEKALNTIEGRKEFLTRILRGEIQVQDIQMIFDRPCEMEDLIRLLGGHLTSIGDGATAFVQDVCLDEACVYQFILRRVHYIKGGPYMDLTNPFRPENVDIEIVKTFQTLLLDQITPHIPFYIGDFVCESPFGETFRYMIVERAEKTLSEWIQTLRTASSKKREAIFGTKNLTEVWRVVLFQIIAALAAVQEAYPSFRHNDLHKENVLVFEHPPDPSKMYRYQFLWTKPFEVPDLGFQIALWDFDLSILGGRVDNAKVFDYLDLYVGIQAEANPYADLFKILNSLYREYYPEGKFKDIPDPRDNDTLSSSDSETEEDSRELPIAVRKFLQRMVPKELRLGFAEGPYVKNGSLLNNIVYTTPRKVLEDPFFDVFRNRKSLSNVLETFTVQEGAIDTPVKTLDVPNEYDLRIDCSIYDERLFPIYYYAYQNPSYDIPQRKRCLSTKMLKPRWQKLSKTQKEALIQEVRLMLGMRTIRTLSEDLIRQAWKDLYIPKEKWPLILLILIDKAYYYRKHKHFYDAKSLEERLETKYDFLTDDKEIVDTWTQIHRYLNITGQEAAYLKKYQSTSFSKSRKKDAS
jgi:hypothetical protein